MKERKRKRAETEQKKGAPLWMVTYGDMVTVVLCFFVLLYSMSTIDARKFELAMLSLRGTFGILEGGRVEVIEERDIPVDVPEPEPEQEINWEQLDDVRIMLEEAISDSGMVELVSVEQEERGLIVRFAEGILFDLGRADLRSEALEVLEGVANVLGDIPNPIRIEGHTDDLPISTSQFPSNWELSTARATSVLRYFLEDHELSPYNLSVAGYGEYRPIADNDTEQGRQKNRRVDVVVLHLKGSADEPG